MQPSAPFSVLQRDIAGVIAQVAAYPDDASLWRVLPGTSNSAGTLARHLAGNLRHFVGHVLGGSGYVRDRAAEFSGEPIPRAAVLAELEAAARELEATFTAVGGTRIRDRLRDAFPAPVAGRRVTAEAFVMHLVAHLGYHLGQIDYLRRTSVGGAAALSMLPLDALPEAP